MKFLTVIVLLSLLAGCFNRVDHTSSPAIDHVAPFYSARTMSRNVDIWLPREYQSRPGQRFPVLYMQDGQNLFNHADATLGIAWDIDRVAQRLMDKGKIKPAIIVAIWSTPRHSLEYFPAKINTYVAEAGVENSNVTPVVTNTLADDYLTFIVDELKPYLDTHYRTLADRNNTFIAGASMGAIFSLYALAEHPDVFGGVGCISADWLFLFANTPHFGEHAKRYLEDKLPVAGAHRFYFDAGAIAAEEYAESPQQQMDHLLHEKGYKQGSDWITKKNPGAGRNENAWQVRTDLMLEFLLGSQIRH